MAYRGRPNPLAPRVVDVETARRAVAQVAAERDALARQLSRAQVAFESVQRQLEARRQENAHLAETVRVLEDQRAGADSGELARTRSRLESLARELGDVRRQLDESRQEGRALTMERDEAVADRDRERAACHASRTELAQLRRTAPDEDRAQRLAADLANLRRHQAAAIERGVREQSDRLFAEMASVRDSIGRALETLPGTAGPWHDGLLAVQSRLDGLFEQEGLHRIGEPGERFDPKLHDAIGTVPEGTPGDVRHTVSTGLARDDGSVVVPAKVIVAAQTR